MKPGSYKIMIDCHDLTVKRFLLRANREHGGNLCGVAQYTVTAHGHRQDNKCGLKLFCLTGETLKRRHPDLNRGIEVLQTSALPLGYAAQNKSGKRDSNSRQPPWQGGALPTELFPPFRQNSMPVLQATPIYIGREVCQLILAPPLTLPSDRCGTLEQRRKPIVLNDLALVLLAPGPSNQSSASTRAPDAAARCGEWS